MASNLCNNHFSIFLILIFISQAFSQTHLNPNELTSPTKACKSTPHPIYCQTILKPQNGNVFDYTRFSVKKSLSQSKITSNLINQYLKRRRSSLSPTAIKALQDCQFLNALNSDFLLSSFQTVNKTTTFLPSSQAENIQTLLSAILTNQQTCLDGLKDTFAPNELIIPLSNDNKLFSVSLALFVKSWVPKTKPKTEKNAFYNKARFQNGRLPLKMSRKTRAIYETVSGRKVDENESFDSVVVKDMVTVSKDGSGNFTTINEAIRAAPNKSVSCDGYFLIYVSAGVYEEYVVIGKKKTYLMMIGDGINKTIITGNHNGADGWTTFNSSTFAVIGEGFVGVNITFRNTAGPTKHQAVAVRNGADLSTFYHCSFEGYQDTLYAHSRRQFYRECDIYGTVDFIFGNAKVVFQNCNIYPRLPLEGQFNAITAQGRTDKNQDTGTSIHNCTIKGTHELVSSNRSVETYLGRPWKKYSRTVYMQTYLDDVINSAGWHAWIGDYALNTLYYAEFNNSGPGSNTDGRVTWQGYHVINATVAANFTVSKFLEGDDWLPKTGVSYTNNLINGK